jgi:ubiquinone/menaquinone biosynthesis C-methylase UbiE
MIRFVHPLLSSSAVNDPPEQPRPICDYEGSRYRTEFWGAGREYEDAVERIALRSLVPPSGGRLVEIGAGYGRLAPLYEGYDEVVFFDYALSQLRQAQELWGETGPGGDPHFVYVAGDFYALPFVPGAFDTVTMIRALHHAADAAAVLRGVAETLGPQGAFVLEFANKRNLKAILRYLVRRQSWSPFEREPVEFVDLNFDFHPAWIRERLAKSGLRVVGQRTVSHFRVELLKRALPNALLVALDRAVQPTGEMFQLTPSVFIRSEAPADRPAAAQGALFRCVACASAGLELRGDDVIACDGCGARYAIRDGIYDFRAPMEDKGP